MSTLWCVKVFLSETVPNSVDSVTSACVDFISEGEAIEIELPRYLVKEMLRLCGVETESGACMGVLSLNGVVSGNLTGVGLPNEPK